MAQDQAGRVGRSLTGFLVLGAGNYLAMGVSLVINALLTRHLGAASFGRLALLLAASQAVLLLTANWTHTAVVRFGAREFASGGSVAETFWTRLWIVAPFLSAAAVVGLAARHPLSAYLGIPSWGLAIVLVHCVATLLLSMTGLAFQARSEMQRYGVVLFLDKAVLLALLVLLPQSWTGSPLLVLCLYAASSSAVAVAGLIALGARSLMPVTFNRAALRAMFSFSAPLIFSSWVGLFGTNWFDLLIIKRYQPDAAVGLYSLGTLLAGVVQQVTIIFSTMLLPQLSVMVADGELDRIRTFVARLLPYWFLATSVLFSGVLLVGGWVVPLIFGAAFEASVPVLAILMVAGCALALFNAFSPLVSAVGSNWILTGVCLASGCVNVLLDLVLIPRYGLTGAAAATVIAYGTSAVLVLWYAQRHLEMPVFGLGLLALPVVVVCAGFLVLDGMRFYLFAAPAGVLTSYWLVRRFRLFRHEDAAFLQQMRVLVPLPRQV